MEGSTPCQCGPALSFAPIFGSFKQLTDLNLFHCRNLHSAGLVYIGECCLSLEKLNIDEVNYLSDESVVTFIDLRGANMKMLWIDGESLSDGSFSHFHKMKKLELLSVSFSDNMGSEGLSSIAKLSQLGNSILNQIVIFPSLTSFLISIFNVHCWLPAPQQYIHIHVQFQ